MVKKVIYKFINRLMHDDFMGYAAQISFYMLVSMIPLLIMLGAGLSRLNIIDVEQLLEKLKLTNMFPESTITLISSMFESVTLPSGSVIGYVLLILWFASRGIRAVMNAIHMTFRTRNNFNIARHFGLSFLYTLLFVVIIMLFTVLIVYGDRLSSILAEALSQPVWVSVVMTVIRYLIPLLFLFFLYSLMYQVIPGKDLNFKSVLPGTILATLGSFIVSQIFSLFATNSLEGYSTIYGGLTGIAIICTWMWLFSLVLILGSELNACVYEVKHNTTLVSFY